MPYAEPVTLTGDLVTLTPLSPQDHDGLVAAAGDGDLWGLTYTSVPRPEAMAAEIERRLGLLREGRMVPFTVRRSATGEPVGMTTLMNLDEPNRRLEIGSTWLARSAQGTGVNAEAKLLMLAHAFETLGCHAVELRTHWLNRQSRAAIERLGAKLDGILRQHMVMPDGSVRDTCVYSVVAAEWPAVRGELQRRLGTRLAGASA
ncbi:GNAT family N-acetyltransferase [Ornithinimicrobium tianjinense]|uniref:GCN5 family N-acetyltransferase n=1 Tax=Ornithinimicrobium tianjinense TaxID=1195761 RepID=A0A917BQR3_9MICO|nr:GNAT family protein [Ornithinimicrobium tianjinense]GGF51007.1 GCN5 family N-acetyltransferase [Ornithinimicrobium tianjinense]